MRASRVIVAVVAAVVAASVLGSAAGARISSRSDAPRNVVQAPPSRFTCYGAQFSSIVAKKFTLSDGIARRLSAIVYVADVVCAPATSKGGRVAGGGNFLACYRIRVSTRFSSTSVRTADEFGRLVTLRLARPSTLCVPSARVDKNRSTTPSSALSRMTCYPATTQPTVSRKDVAVLDEFGESEDAIRGPRVLCTPAWKASARVATGRSLTCYAVDSETKGTTVVVKNELGFLKAALGPRATLCVAATLS